MHSYIRTYIHTYVCTYVHIRMPHHSPSVYCMCTLCWAINVPVHLPFLLKAIDLDNILSLYGVHEKYLNNLVSRFDEKLIDNFFRWPAAAYRATLQLPTLCSMLHMYVQTTHHWYISFCSYFKEPWAVAVFHDRFGAFREEVKELLEKKQVRQRGGLFAPSPTASYMHFTGCHECLVTSSLCRALMAGHSGRRLCNTSQKTNE